MATSPVPAIPTRQKLFISYAREDTDWLEKFLPYFKPAERSGALEIWWDRQIPSGAEWGPILDKEIADASAALVLVSVNLLNSNFILERELPAIHEQRRIHNLQLYWIPVSMVGEEVLQALGLFGINAAAPCEPGKPLDDMEERERELAVVAVCNQILRDLKSGRVGRLSQEKRDDIFGGALARLREKVALAADAPIAFGDFSMVSRGQMQGREVAIKVLAESPFREHNSEFEERVKKALSLEDAYCPGNAGGPAAGDRHPHGRPRGEAALLRRSRAVRGRLAAGPVPPSQRHLPHAPEGPRSAVCQAGRRLPRAGPPGAGRRRPGQEELLTRLRGEGRVLRGPLSTVLCALSGGGGHVRQSEDGGPVRQAGCRAPLPAELRRHGHDGAHLPHPHRVASRSAAHHRQAVQRLCRGAAGDGAPGRRGGGGRGLGANDPAGGPVSEDPLGAGPEMTGAASHRNRAIISLP